MRNTQIIGMILWKDSSRNLFLILQKQLRFLIFRFSEKFVGIRENNKILKS